jgi:hypothetical protein
VTEEVLSAIRDRINASTLSPLSPKTATLPSLFGKTKPTLGVNRRSE